YDNLPKIKELRDLVQKSFTVPKSSKYPYKNRCHDDIDQLANGVSASRYTQDGDDMSLSADVEECLPNLLQIVRQVDALQVLGLDPLEADRRHPIDTLGSLVWDIQSDGLVYRTQSGSPECRFILHWVTEFKRTGDEKPSKQQVVEGLVSGLYQRRALGFPNHFIFGTAHHSETTLEVLAATWVPSEPVDPRADSLQDVDRQSAAPPVDQEDDPAGSLSLKGYTTGGTSGAGPKLAGAGDNLTAKDIKKYNKIVVYSIATYSMMQVEDLLQLYLLMRQTRFSADEYRTEIKKRGKARINELSVEAPDIYRWPPPPLPDTDRGSRTSASKKRRLDDLPEAQDSMSVDEYDDSDSGSDQEEADSASDVDCKHGVTGNSYVHTVTGDVGTYTIKNYAYKGDVGAGIVGDPYIVQ
ncbi:hypothetical protein FRC11_009190, partial [Ceratobasidium sp. 423]